MRYLCGHDRALSSDADGIEGGIVGVRVEDASGEGDSDAGIIGAVEGSGDGWYRGEVFVGPLLT